MDTAPLADIETTSSPAVVDSAVASSSPQPTYTTAGTIYKPSSSQPLQPPTRRGRLPKWSDGNIHSKLALFPKSSLPGMSMKALGGRPNSALQQYTPLQQNNHRAVSPFSEPDHLVAKMPIETPRIRLGSTPNALSVPTMPENSSQEKAATEDGEHCSLDGSDDDSEDSESKITLLMNMPVKSLYNLASYQNPTQKYAQRALKRGTKRPLTLGSSSMGSTTSTSPPTLSAFNPPSSSNEIGGPSNLGHQGPTDIFGFRRGELDAASRVDDMWDARIGTPTPPFPNPSRINLTFGDAPNPIANSASASGTLLPLTAGPPGQRQYRPVAVESTFRPFVSAGPSSLPTSNPADEDTLQIANRVLFEAGIEDVSIDSLGSLFAENLHSAPSSYPIWDGGAGNAEPRGPVLPTEPVYEDEMQNQFRNIAGPMERMKVWDPNERLIQTKSWRDPSPEVRALYKPGTDRLTDEALAARNNELNKWWYSRVDNTHDGTRPENIPGNIPFPQSLPRADQDFGVIGDRRLKTPKSLSEKASAGEASVEETTQQTTEKTTYVIIREITEDITEETQETTQETTEIFTSENAGSLPETHSIREAEIELAQLALLRE
ncbi:hypothetical protein MAA_03868 [Metarhizium robertsii ARSEF 23]|uniref:Uncharacterized protein n=1 Tax=Metarhizium robertsii (strain ARSEF 23 / ATCC MYA-3075) TaxID=655844 RepID=E9EV19_METRA|nr:uncharacterized protein MAA_03868 [Metarhizium robertsii ARSEF 23]EFZ01272.1 hypothetical protein MAA_03868 [Metarhizium robertsii ARSEF 23]